MNTYLVTYETPTSTISGRVTAPSRARALELARICWIGNGAAGGLWTAREL